ncbi:unnamed protein product, partial [Closterium sp. NIES-53]
EAFIDRSSRAFCIVMEYCRKGELCQHLKKRSNMAMMIPEDTILNWFVQLVLALEYLHHKNILHRDVKAENVFLRSRHDTPLGNAATVQLGDFGISRMLEAHEAVARSFVGTPLYMSPELIRNEPYDHKSDIWALGCILYEMMCFTKPFPATSIRDLVLRVLKSNYRPPPHIYSPELCFLLTKMLSKDASRRPTAADILAFPLLRPRAAAFLAACQLAASEAAESHAQQQQLEERMQRQLQQPQQKQHHRNYQRRDKNQEQQKQQQQQQQEGSSSSSPFSSPFSSPLTSPPPCSSSVPTSPLHQHHSPSAARVLAIHSEVVLQAHRLGLHAPLEPLLSPSARARVASAEGARAERPRAPGSPRQMAAAGAAEMRGEAGAGGEGSLFRDYEASLKVPPPQ